MSLDQIRRQMRTNTLAPEGPLLRSVIETCNLSIAERASISANAAEMIADIRANGSASMMEVFLEEYGLSSKEGVALMCLAEALLRVPDTHTMDALIEDKIAPSNWAKHIGSSTSPLVNASTWALMLTGKVLDDEPPGLVGTLKGAIKRLGEPVIRTAVKRAMSEMGQQFVLGRNIDEAMKRASAMEAKGYSYSYDMLGEAARTEADAKRYHLSYAEAISTIAKAAKSTDVRENPGISIKLSALHPRYEYAQKERVMLDLVPRARALALLAKSANMGLNIDAEEADRLDLSLDIIAALLGDPALEGWSGFGVVVQAYSKRAPDVLDWLYALAEKHDRRIMVRLVKGAYWDTEIKRAQTLGLDGFPVFTRKASTDVNYIACARKLLSMTDRIYPQFATHNAHSIAAILHMADDVSAYEFQRLHGMGETLHNQVLIQYQTNCRIYAPVGAHQDLLAYLVRRLLENGANSSFVNQIVDQDIPPEVIAADPISEVESVLPDGHNPKLRRPCDLYPDRKNAIGWDIFDPSGVDPILEQREAFTDRTWRAAPLLANATPSSGQSHNIINPATGAPVGIVQHGTVHDASAAHAAATAWADPNRAEILLKAAELYEENATELFALLAREAGKTLSDAVSELREAVDFLRYYAGQVASLDAPPLGTVTAISPWNFPLAIFTGQIAGALAAGNAVIAKPAETTPLVAHKAVELLHSAGVPKTALQFLPGEGPVVGTQLVAETDATLFTGSTATAQAIHRHMAQHASPWAPLVAETGGINAMIVDSTALPEQAVRDIIASAFQSAGQRCSALRVLFVQDEIADQIQEMLFGAMDSLRLGDPWRLDTDIGPVIDAAAQNRIKSYVDEARQNDRVLNEVRAPSDGTFVAPTVIACTGMADVTQEVFGPVLHLARFAADQLDQVLKQINDSGYGLTFGLHSRIDDRVDAVTSKLNVGNIYVNRNQIGAVVGSQPFGGEGLSGTGPKAGGPDYVPNLTRAKLGAPDSTADVMPLPIDLPGPTGESNVLSYHATDDILCLGDKATDQAAKIRSLGATASVMSGSIPPASLTTHACLAGVVFDGEEKTARAYRKALAARIGPIVQLHKFGTVPHLLRTERHLCVDTTASGGNAQLLAAMGDDPQ